MDDPDFTAAHLEELRAVGRGERMGYPAPGVGPTDEDLDLTEWRLTQWDAGMSPGHAQRGGAKQVRPPGVKLTPAGRIVLALAQSLDGPTHERITTGSNTMSMDPTQEDIDAILALTPPAGWRPTDDRRGAVQALGWRVEIVRPADPVFVVHAPPGETLGPEVSVSVHVFAYVAALCGVKSLDGTAPPSEHRNPGAKKERTENR